MGLVISVYTKEAFKEFILPSINNADYFLTIHQSFFGLQEDLHLQLEVIDDVWRLKPRDTYFIYYMKQRLERPVPLKDQEYLQLLTNYNEQISILVSVVERPLSVYGKYQITSAQEISIGRNSTNTIQYNNHDLIAREHAVLRRTENQWEIVSLSKNGVYVNGAFVQNTKKLYFGDYINIVGLHMVFMDKFLAVDSGNQNVQIHSSALIPVNVTGEGKVPQQENVPAGSSKIVFHRAPRTMETIETDPIEIEEPPKQQKGRKQSMLMTIGPSFTMTIPMLLGCLLMVAASRQSGAGAGLYMWSGVVMSGSSAVIGVIWAIVSLREQKKQETADQTHRFEAFSNYLLEKTEEVKRKYEQNQQALRNMYPDAKTCTGYDDSSVMLWNRNATHPDFLSHRLGMGNLPFQVMIDIPKKKFSMDEDSLAEKPRLIKQNYETLYDVPVQVDLLEHRLIGVIGGRGKEGASSVVRALSAQIAACNCYTDVKLAYIYNNEDSADLGKYDFAKWFPHAWSEDKKIRYVASSKAEASDVFYEITKVFRQRADLGKKAGIYKPHFVMFISDASLIENELIAKYIFDENQNYGLTVLILADSYEQLPNACEYIIENDDHFQGIYVTTSGERLPIRFDEVSLSRMERFARRLSNLEVQETENGGEIPSMLTFFDMYGITSLPQLKVEERWLKNRTYDNIKGLLGQKAGGAPCYMDVHEKYHGPHGLVAGTTGSGKSETLQTYMLSLAINYSPDDVGFFIIDYKGGGMANLFEGLPHMIGQISNLSGNQVRRAMVSIKSENKRRQRIFNENDVNNINAYTKLYKNGEASEPVPHLFIIIDEFAELKKEEPDFMKELISVAQVGRSLGVHLILATQKPSGTVDDNIWSNSKFRLCLRVQDRQDSNDMLHKPDAAYITQAGRGYLQVGNDEVYELFQSGWSGAPYIESTDNIRTEIAKVLNLTGRADAVGSHAKMAKKEKELYQWVKTIAECFLRVLKKKGMTDLGQMMTGRMEIDALVQDVYLELAQKGIEYPESKYNSARLEDFAGLLREVLSDPNRGNVVKKIVILAKTRGIKLPQVKEKSQLDAVKEYLAMVARKNGYTHNHQLWLPVLTDHLLLDEFEEYRKTAFENGQWQTPTGAWTLEVLMGKIDDPVNQSQIPMYLSFPSCGNIAVCGSVVSGKSTFLQTMVYGLITRYTPDYLNIYALDFSSRMMSAFENDIHVGGVMYENDLDKIGRFFNMIGKILEERKRLFRGGNYSQYVQVHGVVCPAILIFVDNYSAFKEKTQEAYEDQMITLSKEGVSHGIFLVVSGAGFGMNEITNRVGENMKTVVALEMADKYAYADLLHTMQIDVLPEVGVKGRGLTYYGNRVLEFQTALALEAEDDFQRMEGIAAKCEEMKGAYHGKTAKKVPTIPENPVWTEFEELEEVQMMLQTPELLPVAYNSQNAEIYGMNLREFYCYLITGGPRGGKKNYMKLMILSAFRKGARIAILDSPEKKLKAMEALGELAYTCTEDEMIEYFINTLKPIFQTRNKRKNELIQQGLEDSEVFDTMLAEETSYFLFIPDFEWFLNVVYDKNINGFMETLFERGALHNIYFVSVLALDKRSMVSGYDAFRIFTKDRNGIHFGGNLASDPILNYDYVEFQEQNKTLKTGIGALPEVNGEHPVERIIAPLAKWK